MFMSHVCHMQVRESLLSRQKGMEQKEKLRKLRDLKKYGKKVQQEILQKRREEKKVALESVKRFRKGKGERPSFLSRDEDEDDGFPVEAQEQPPREGGPSRRPEKRAMSKKRMAKVCVCRGVTVVHLIGCIVNASSANLHNCRTSSGCVCVCVHESNFFPIYMYTSSVGSKVWIWWEEALGQKQHCSIECRYD